MERTENERAGSDRRSEGGIRFGALFAALFVLVYAVALLPPVYISLSRQHALIAAVPASIWYLILTSAAPIAVTYGLWLVESRRGALD